MSPLSTQHVAVWLDQEEARIFLIEPASFEASTLRAPRHHVRRHPEREAPPKEHPEDAKRFFRDISAALSSAEEILIVGPSTAKLHFMAYVHGNEPALAKRIIGIETVDHPTDGQLAAYARHYFVAADRTIGGDASTRMVETPRKDGAHGR